MLPELLLKLGIDCGCEERKRKLKMFLLLLQRKWFDFVDTMDHWWRYRKVISITQRILNLFRKIECLPR